MPLRRLEHLLVLTDDIRLTKAFYCDALGFEVAERPLLPFPGYWLSIDGVVCLHIAERAPYDAHAATLGLVGSGSPVDHVAFASDGYEQLVERLREAGVDSIENDVPAAGVRQVFLDDPNGVRIELNLR